MGSGVWSTFRTPQTANPAKGCKRIRWTEPCHSIAWVQPISILMEQKIWWSSAIPFAPEQLICHANKRNKIAYFCSKLIIQFIQSFRLQGRVAKATLSAFLFEAGGQIVHVLHWKASVTWDQRRCRWSQSGPCVLHQASIMAKLIDWFDPCTTQWLL